MFTAGDGLSGRPAVGRGFTLIELLVVIAVIALLVAILMPSLNQAKELAIRAKCAVELKHIGQGIHQYAEDYDGWMPYTDSNAYGHALNGGMNGKVIRLGSLWAKESYPLGWSNPASMGYWQYFAYPSLTRYLEPEDYADYIPSLDNLYCPGREYPGGRAGQNDGGWHFYVHGGYSYCIPSTTSHDFWMAFRRDDWRDPFRQAWAYNPNSGEVPVQDALGRSPFWGSGQQNLNTWVTCLEESNMTNQRSDPHLPHGGDGWNVLHREGSVHWFYEKTVSDWQWYSRAGTSLEDCSSWVVFNRYFDDN